MKNIIILGLVAALLFSVSATLSVWLYRPPTTADQGESPSKAAKKPSAKPKSTEEPEPESPKPAIRPRPSSGGDDLAKLSAQYSEQSSALRDREARLERRQSQLELVMQDVRAERQSLDSLRLQVTAELKLLTQKVSELEALRQSGAKTAAEARTRQAEQDENERKNFDRLATVSDAMPAENAARILQQMADMGKLDMAARLLAQMKERQAAKVLSEITDPALAAQMLERMKTVRRSPPPPVPQPTAVPTPGP